LPWGEVNVGRDSDGRLTALRTSWGAREEVEYGTDAIPRRVREERDGATSAVEFDGLRPVSVRQFDGGESRYEYTPPGEGSRLKRVRTPDGLILSYEYDRDGRVVAVDCGTYYRLEYTYDAEGQVVAWTCRSPRS
jgi:YD repeat-containing protein